MLVRLLLGENPIGGFGQIASGGTDGDGVALAALDAFIEMGDILHPPVGVMAMADDDIGGFNKCPLQVGVALFDQATVVSPAGAGADLGDKAGVAGEVLGSREAVDGTDLAIDDVVTDWLRIAENVWLILSAFLWSNSPQSSCLR